MLLCVGYLVGFTLFSVDTVAAAEDDDGGGVLGLFCAKKNNDPSIVNNPEIIRAIKLALPFFKTVAVATW